MKKEHKISLVNTVEHLEKVISKGAEEGFDVEALTFLSGTMVLVMGRTLPIAATESERVTEALNVIARFGGIDGAHHKTWVIDQVARCLLGDRYKEWVTDMMAGEDGPATYGYDEGITP